MGGEDATKTIYNLSRYRVAEKWRLSFYVVQRKNAEKIQKTPEENFNKIRTLG